MMLLPLHSRSQPLLLRVPPPAMSLGMPASIATDPYSVFAVLACTAAFGQRAAITAVGKRLSGPICSMGLAFAMASCRILPPATATVANAQALAVRLATPLLLLDADLRSIGRRARQVLPAFFLATVGTILGALLASTITGGALAAQYGDDAYKMLAALAAKNIGGGMNFVAVAASLGLSAGPFTMALAMDNIMALVYFPLCAWLGRADPDPKAAVEDLEGKITPTATAPPEGPKIQGKIAPTAALREPLPRASVAPAAAPEVAAADVASTDEARSAWEQSAALAIALCSVAASQRLASRFAPGFDLPIATALVVAAATALPRVVGRFAASGSRLGTTSIYLFFATAGWTGGSVSTAAVLQGGTLVLAFLLLLYAVHIAVVLGVGSAATRAIPSSARLWRRPLLLVGSNANIGGPGTASALAIGNGWPSLVTPSLLVGNLGIALATPIGILLHATFRAIGCR